MIPGNPFILASKGQGHDSQLTKKVPAWVTVIALVSARFFYFCRNFREILNFPVNKDILSHDHVFFHVTFYNGLRE